MVPNALTCPNCGYGFAPPAGVPSCFCPSCGTRIDVAQDAVAGGAPTMPAMPTMPVALTMPAMPATPSVMSPEEAQERAQRAIEQAARAAELAAQAARLAEQAGSRLQATELAQLATAQAAEALHAAQESQREQERQVRDRNERLAAEQADLERRMAEQAALAAQAEQAAQAARAKEAAQAPSSAVAQTPPATVAARATGPVAGRGPAPAAGAVSPADKAPSNDLGQSAAVRPRGGDAQGRQAQAARQEAPRKVSYRQGATVCHTDGTGLFVVTLPSDWSVRDSGIRREAARPFNPHVQLSNGRGASIHLFQGDTGMRLSAGMKAAMAAYGAALAGADETNYAEVPNPIKLADDYVADIVRRVGASDLRLTGTLDAPDLAARRQEALALFQENARAGGGAIVCDPLAAEVLRTYRFMLNGELTGFAVHVRLYATKDGSGVENLNPMGLAANVGSALGGLFRKRKAAKSSAAANGSGRPSRDTRWSQPDFDSYVDGGTIYWEVVGIATLSAPATTFDEALGEAFLPLVRSYGLHADVRGMALGDTRRQAGRMQQATNHEIQANNMRTQASMAAARQAQAAADARFDQWMRDSDAHHAAFRERTNAAFNTAAGGSAPDFSEAIRGVNTYRTSDGREVEVDVSADRAWENQAGDVIGTEGSFEPGYDWTEIPRA